MMSDINLDIDKYSSIIAEKLIIGWTKVARNNFPPSWNKITIASDERMNTDIINFTFLSLYKFITKMIDYTCENYKLESDIKQEITEGFIEHLLMYIEKINP